MAVDLKQLLDDLADESGDVEALLEPLTPDQWDLPTPAAGWAIRDQVSHLAYFDETAALAVTDSDRFRADAVQAMSRGVDFADAIAKDFRDRPPGELRCWFRKTRRDMIAIFRRADPTAKVPWYGPSMSVASSVTARIMETWAHGQDIADALGVTRVPTARLRHIAHLGVRTRPFSYIVRGQEPPKIDVRVELVSPDGDLWTWGNGENVVAGPALDFCLVVTQRRHVADTALTVTGSGAAEWMSVAQAFAGPPGPGRPPGEST